MIAFLFKFKCYALFVPCTCRESCKLFFLWSVSRFCGFTIATKGAKPHGHQKMLPGAQPGEGNGAAVHKNF